MIYSMDLRNGIDDLRKKMEHLDAMQKKYPCSKIMRTTNKGKEVYYKVEYDQKKRIRKSVSYGEKDFWDLIRGLCIEAKRELIGRNIRLLEDIRSEYSDIGAGDVIRLVTEKYPKVDAGDILTAVRELDKGKHEPSEWAKTPYRKADFLEDGRTQITSRGLKVRSKSELAICEILYANDVEFRYEEILYLNGERFIPDFTIRRRSDGKIFYWEHCGMMDDANYRRRHLRKLKSYEEAGIVPWDNLIVTYDKDGSIDMKRIEAMVKAVLTV